MTRSSVRFKPESTPWLGRPWEARCHRPGCERDEVAWTWHLSWWHAMGRVGEHIRAAHSQLVT